MTSCAQCVLSLSSSSWVISLRSGCRWCAPGTVAHLNDLDLICATCGFSAGLFGNLCVGFMSVSSPCARLTHAPPLLPSLRDTFALIGDRPCSSSPPPGARSRIKPEALKNNLSPAVCTNMAPVRPHHTARLNPPNTHLPPPKSIVTVKYDSLEVDTVIVAPASLRSCNAGHGSCFTLQQSVRLPETEGSFRVAGAINTCVHLQTYRHGESREGGEGTEWKIPSRLLVIYSTHAFLHLTHSSNVFSNQQRWGLCVKLSVSVSLPSPHMSTVQNAQDDGSGRVSHINPTRCYAIAGRAINAC